mgnify:CR=1 FL=1
MINISPVLQKPNLCGPACLKMVLRYYNLSAPRQHALAKLCKTSIHTGTSGENILKAAKKLKLTGFIKDFAEYRELIRWVEKKRVPVIVDWFAEEDGHYSVVLKATPCKIYLQDPEIGHIRVMSRKDFVRVWFDFTGDFITGKGDIRVRRMIVIQPKNKTKN